MRSRERIAVSCCGVTLAFVALAFGGAVRWAALGASVGAVATAAAFVGSRRSAIARSPLLILLGVALGLTALQLLPLPIGLADVVASAKVELVTDNANAWRAAIPSFVMASYDPPATLLELAKLAGYAALAFAALRLAGQRETQRILAMFVVGSAVLVALVALVHVAVGATEIYGMFPPATQHPLVSPIVNDNHFASLMALAVPVALGLAVTGKTYGRAVWIGCASLTAVSCLLVSSRGGAIGLGIGVVVAVALMLFQWRTERHDGSRTRRVSIVAIVIGCCVVILIIALGAQEVTSELSTTRLDTLASDPHWKFQGWRYALDMLSDHPWLGTGRGAFEFAFTQWAPVGDITFSHAENTYVQVAVDWGIPGAIAIAAAGIAMGLAAARRWRHGALEACALAALVALAAHEVVDFSLELPIVAMAAILLIAIIIPVRLDAGKAPLPPRRRSIRGGLLAIALGVCAVSASPFGEPAHQAATRISTPEVAKLITERHPADYLLMGRAAQLLNDVDDPRALDVLARGLVLNPKHAGLHRFAATLLVRAHHQAQAAVELSLALRYAPDAMFREIVDQIIATFPEPLEAARAFPLDLGLAEQIMHHIGAHKAVAFEYARRLASMNPLEARPQLLFAKAAIAADHSELALSPARSAFAIQPTVASAITLANAEALNGNPAAGIAILREAVPTLGGSSSERVDLLSVIVDLELASGAFAQAAASLDELSHLITDRGGLIQLHLRRASLHDHLNEPNLANWERAKAAQLIDPTGDR